MAEPLDWSWRGRVPYTQALQQQRARRAAIQSGAAPEALWLLEHDPVITLGRRGAEGLSPPDVLAARGVAVIETERGGLATFHGPGQLVAYLLVDAHGRGWGVRRFVAAIEDALITWLDTLGVRAGRRDGLPGVWSGTDKIAALGLHFSRGVSMHGLAVNLTTDLSWFDLFVPCGVTDGGVTSVAELTGNAPDPKTASELLGPILADRLSSGAAESVQRP
jgi:lipoyl(octanoyl) transferase